MEINSVSYLLSKSSKIFYELIYPFYVIEILKKELNEKDGDGNK